MYIINIMKCGVRYGRIMLIFIFIYLFFCWLVDGSAVVVVASSQRAIHEAGFGAIVIRENEGEEKNRARKRGGSFHPVK